MRASIGHFVGLTTMLLFVSAAHGPPQQADLESAKAMVQSGHADQALALVDGIIAKAMLNDAKKPDAICPGVAAAFLQTYIKGGVRISVENDWCEAMLVRGYALNELKRPTEAAQTLKELLGHAPDNVNYLAEYAYTVRLTGEVERSLELYKRTETLASNLSDRPSAAHWRAVALRGQGFALTELQRWDEATKAYQRSLKYEPKSEIARDELRYIAEHRPQ